MNHILIFEYLVKLPFTTGRYLSYTESYRCTENGLEGIHDIINDLAKDKKINRCYPYLLIQPWIDPNTECKITCFNGDARFEVNPTYDV